MIKLMTWVALAALAWNVAPIAAAADDPPEWFTPMKPFRIADGLYYVGSMDLASYLITTPQGNILINSGSENSVPAHQVCHRAAEHQVRGHQGAADQPRAQGS